MLSTTTFRGGLNLGFKLPRYKGAFNTSETTPSYIKPAKPYQPPVAPTQSTQPTPQAVVNSPTFNATPQTNLYTPPQKGLIDPRNVAITGDPLFSAQGKTPEQIRAEATGTTGIGSQAPTIAPTTPPVTQSSNPTQMSGLVNNALNQARTYYNNQQGLTTQAQDVAKRIGQEQAAITGQYQGTASDEAGRIAQLEQIKQSTEANIAQQQATQAGYEAPLASLYGTSIGASRPTGAFPFVFNPLTGKFDTAGAAGGAGTATGGTASPTLTYNPTQDAQTLAESVINGSIPYKDAQSAMGYAGSVGPGLLQTAITNAGGNVTQLEAQASATQTNINTQNTAKDTTMQGVYNTAKQKVYALNTSINDIQSLGALTIKTAKGQYINPMTLQIGNETIKYFRNQLSSNGQSAFDSNMANFESALTNIYSSTSGATPTTASNWSKSIANGSMTVPQLQAVYKMALKEGNLRLSNLNNTADSAYNQLQGTQGSSSGTQTTQGGTGFSNSSFYGS